MLLQKHGEKLHPVYAISRRTSEIEANYHSSKLELLAIVWALERLRMFLINIKFHIITDWQALVYLNAKKTKNSQIVRWYNSISEFEFDISHRPGEKLQHVDALSRAPVEQSQVEYEERISVFNIITREDEIVLYQSTDDDLRRKINILKKPQPERTPYEKGEVKDYELKEGILYKRHHEHLLYVIPKHMRKSLLVRYHDLQGHFGLDRTYHKIVTYYYFPGMKRYIRQHIRSCLQCIMTKSKTGKQAGELHPIEPGKRPFQIVHADHLGPFITSSRNNKYIFVLIDNLTKLVKLEAMKDTKTEGVIKKLEDFILDFGAPETLITDRGTCFTSYKFETFCTKHGIQHVLNSPRHAQANGQVEIVNKTLVPVIQAAVNDPEQRDWDRHLKKIALDLNESVNKTTNESPFKLLYGYYPRHDEGELRKLSIDLNPYHKPELLQDQARNRILSEQQKYKARYDRNRYRNVHYKDGDIVYLKTVSTNTGESTKLQNKYRGPLVITKVLPNDTYGITDLRDNESGRRYATTAHVSQLKLWIPHEDDDLDESCNLEEDPSKRRTAPPSRFKDYVTGRELEDEF